MRRRRWPGDMMAGAWSAVGFIAAWTGLLGLLILLPGCGAVQETKTVAVLQERATLKATHPIPVDCDEQSLSRWPTLPHTSSPPTDAEWQAFSRIALKAKTRFHKNLVRNRSCHCTVIANWGSEADKLAAPSYCKNVRRPEIKSS